MYKEIFKKGSLFFLTSCLLSNVAFASDRRGMPPLVDFVIPTNSPNYGEILSAAQGITDANQRIRANVANVRTATNREQSNSRRQALANNQVQNDVQNNIVGSNEPVNWHLSKEELKTLQEKQQKAVFNSLVSAVDALSESLGSQGFRASLPASGEQELAHGIWFGSGFSFGKAKFDKNTKFSPKATSLTLGYDTEVSQNVAVGMFASFVDLQNSSKSLKLKQKESYVLGGVYGSAKVEGFNLSSAFMVGHGSGKVVDNTGATGNSTKSNKVAYGGNLKAAYQMQFDASTLAPMVAVRYFATANGADDTSNNAKNQSLATDVGVKYTYSIEGDDFNIKPSVTVGYRMDMINSAALNAKDSRKGKVFAGVGLGAQNQSFDFGLNGGALYAKNFQNYSVSLKVLAKF